MLDLKKDAQNVSTVEAQNAAKEILEDAEYNWEEIFPILTKYNTRDYNVMKLLEELSELSEVLLKTETKIASKRPPVQDIIDEVGDVVLRLGVYVHMRGEEVMGKAIDTRIENKAKKLLEYVAAGKYPGGV